MHPDTLFEEVLIIDISLFLKKYIDSGSFADFYFGKFGKREGREGEKFGKGPSVPELCLKQRHVLPKGCHPAHSPALCNIIPPHSHPLKGVCVGGFLGRKG